MLKTKVIAAAMIAAVSFAYAADGADAGHSQEDEAVEALRFAAQGSVMWLEVCQLPLSLQNESMWRSARRATITAMSELPGGRDEALLLYEELAEKPRKTRVKMPAKTCFGIIDDSRHAVEVAAAKVRAARATAITSSPE